MGGTVAVKARPATRCEQEYGNRRVYAQWFKDPAELFVKVYRMYLEGCSEHQPVEDNRNAITSYTADRRLEGHGIVRRMLVPVEAFAQLLPNRDVNVIKGYFEKLGWTIEAHESTDEGGNVVTKPYIVGYYEGPPKTFMGEDAFKGLRQARVRAASLVMTAGSAGAAAAVLNGAARFAETPATQVK